MYVGLTEFDESWPANLTAPSTRGINRKPYDLPDDVVVPYFNVAQPWLDAWPTYNSIPAFSEQDFIIAQNGQPTSLSDWTEPSGVVTPPRLRSTSPS